MPRNSGIKSKNVYAKSMIFVKKNVYHPDLSLRPQVSFTNHRAICAVVFDGTLLNFSPLFHLQIAAVRKLITALTHGDKLEV